MIKSGVNLTQHIPGKINSRNMRAARQILELGFQPTQIVEKHKKSENFHCCRLVSIFVSWLQISKQLIGKLEIVVIKVCGMHQICFLHMLNLLDILQIHEICPGCPDLKCSKDDVSTALISNMYFCYKRGGSYSAPPHPYCEGHATIRWSWWKHQKVTGYTPKTFGDSNMASTMFLQCSDKALNYVLKSYPT